MDSEDVANMSPIIDRISTLENLMENEAKFQYKKAQLVKLYMEAYEHIVDPLEQQRFIQFVTDLMAERPRLNLDSNSFEDSYKLEFQILDKKKELLQNIIRFQINNERRENVKISDYLERSHKLINESLEQKWIHLRPDNVNEELKMRGIYREGENQPKPQSSSMTPVHPHDQSTFK